MEQAIQPEVNPQKVTISDRRANTKLKFKQKVKKKPFRAFKNVKKFVIEREMGWKDSFVYDKIPSIVGPIFAPRRLYRKKSYTNQNNHSTISHTTKRVPSEVKFRIQTGNSPHNLFSVRSMPTQYRSGKKVTEADYPQLIKSLQNDLTKTYMMKEIPECHINIIKAIRQKLGNKQYELKLLRSELKELRSPRSCIFGLKSLCEAREHSLATLKTLIEVTKLDKSNNETKMQNIKEHLQDIRTLGLSCIQKILKWKELMLEFCKFTQRTIEVKFSYSEEDNGNYLLKILHDTEFLHKSQLFKDSIFPDPFLLSYEKELDIEMKKYFKIRACELLLLEESL